jgi:kynurenine formamidase
MLIDLSVKVSQFVREEAVGNKKMVSFGHVGTHFDVMNKEFPLSYTKRKGIVFDVSGYRDDDIELRDDDLLHVHQDMFVAFYSGFIDHVAYGTKPYFKDHPQLSHELIDHLLEKEISIIGIDFAGVRRGKEHTPIDQYCADKGVFIVENLCRLEHVLRGKPSNNFIANTYPVHFEGMSGLPCRVVAEI